MSSYSPAAIQLVMDKRSSGQCWDQISVRNPSARVSAAAEECPGVFGPFLGAMKANCSYQQASLWAMIVEGWLPRAAATRPDGVALQTPHGTLSYSELFAAASAAADELVALGALPGQRVAI